MMITTVCTAIALAATAAPPAKPPVELGSVDWGRNFEAAQAASQASGKPIFLLFQEVPGCQDFGAGALSHPLLVEAIEHAFEPVAIHNNKSGYDEAILKRFDEPSWNYPVIRFVDSAGTDLIPRRDQVYAPGKVAHRMIEALRAADRPVPGYLELAAAELRTTAPETATFAMHCYWVGEAKLGAIDGVVDTRAAWVDSHEVVEVRFDPALLDYTDLVRRASDLECASVVYAHTDAQHQQAQHSGAKAVSRITTPARTAKPSDQKYSLTHSPARWLPLTPMQAMKANALLASRESIDAILSPSQRELLAAITSAMSQNPDAFDGLERPDVISELPTYESRLRRQIAAASDTTSPNHDAQQGGK